QYPLSAAIYRIIAKGDEQYADFLHETGYGKGFKLFTFSQIDCAYKIAGDRFKILSDSALVLVAFHLPEAAEGFIKGLFQNERIEIADKKSKATFQVETVEAVRGILTGKNENEIITITVRPLSPVVAALPNERGHKDYLAPGDEGFVKNILFNWRNKIESCFDIETARSAILIVETLLSGYTPKSRLVAIREGKPEETRIRGWMNFRIKLTAEKRFLELLLNAGMGEFNAMGFGMIGE
ncbi:MAG: CRISPR-associated endoribonuclease Cas6, partial [Chitinophagaceae bacterium]|nr:CRISPR-associated endoribonuclease Cas6 [Chitinophagaceae bacterium]